MCAALGIMSTVVMCHLNVALLELIGNLNRGVDSPEFKITASKLTAAEIKRYDGSLARAGEVFNFTADLIVLACRRLQDEPAFAKTLRTGRHVLCVQHHVSGLVNLQRAVECVAPSEMQPAFDEFDALPSTANTNRRRTQREVEFERLMNMPQARPVSGPVSPASRHSGHSEM